VRIYIIASVLIILGLIAIAYQSSLPTGSWQLPYVTNLSSALLVGGLISLLFRSFQERESDKTLRRLMRIHDSVDELGLVEIVAQHQGYNFTGIIEMSDHLTIVMNDGLRWIGNNTVALRIRFGKDGLTELFTVDPDSPFVESLARKTSVSTEDLKKKIHDTWRRLEETYNDSTKQGKLKIYRLKTYPTRSIFQTEELVVETPYQTASGRINIPAFVYRRVAATDSLYEFAKHDIDAMRKEATLEKEYA
jgi:hypothetical protein